MNTFGFERDVLYIRIVVVDVLSSSASENCPQLNSDVIVAVVEYVFGFFILFIFSFLLENQSEKYKNKRTFIATILSK